MVATIAPAERAPTTKPADARPKSKDGSVGADAASFELLLSGTYPAFGAMGAASSTKDVGRDFGLEPQSARDGRLATMRDADAGGAGRVALNEDVWQSRQEGRIAEAPQRNTSEAETAAPKPMEQITPNAPPSNARSENQGTAPQAASSEPPRHEDAKASTLKPDLVEQSNQPKSSATKGPDSMTPVANTQPTPPDSKPADVVDSAGRQASRVSAIAAGRNGDPGSKTGGRGPEADLARSSDLEKSASAAKKAASGSPPSRAESQRAMFERIAHVLKMQSQSGTSSARIRLDPPALGRVDLQMRMSGDVLRVRLTPESEDARRLLMSDADQLKVSLERHGVKVDRLEILASTESRGFEDHTNGRQDPGSMSGGTDHGSARANGGRQPDEFPSRRAAIDQSAVEESEASDSAETPSSVLEIDVRI
jgi:flagellar hook-length control protein FliK